MGAVLTASNAPSSDRSSKVVSVLGAIGLVVLTALATYFVAGWNANDSAIQQRQILAWQEFNRTGAAVDVAVTNLGDAVVDRTEGTNRTSLTRQLDANRQAARRAIAEHMGSALAMSEVVGKANMDAYLVGVGTLRQLVDDTENPPTAMRASQARFELMHNRGQISDEARRNIHESRSLSSRIAKWWSRDQAQHNSATGERQP